MPECRVAKLGGKMRKSLIRRMRNGLQSRLRRFDSDPSLQLPLPVSVFSRPPDCRGYSPMSSPKPALVTCISIRVFD